MNFACFNVISVIESKYFFMAGYNRKIIDVIEMKTRSKNENKKFRKKR